MTLHQRIEVFFLRSGFKFKAYHIGDMGHRAADLFRVLYPQEPLRKIATDERREMIMVCDYPDYFIPILDQLIRNKRKEVNDSAIQFKINLGLINPPSPIVLELIKPNMQRKRKPIPAYRSR